MSRRCSIHFPSSPIEGNDYYKSMASFSLREFESPAPSPVLSIQGVRVHGPRVLESLDNSGEL